MTDIATYDEVVIAFNKAMRDTLAVDELREWLAEDCAQVLFGLDVSPFMPSGGDCE